MSLGTSFLVVFLVYLLVVSVYFRVSLKRGQTPSAKIQGGASTNPRGDNPIIIKDGESQLLRGRKSIPRGRAKALPGPPPPKKIIIINKPLS